MTNIVGIILFRAVLPLSLLGATLMRYNGISFGYGLFLLIGPLLNKPSAVSMTSHTGRYLVCIVAFSSVAILAQVIFQSYLLAIATDIEPYGSTLGNCTTLETALREVGLQRLASNDLVNILRVVLPDICIFLVSIIILIICRKLYPASDIDKENKHRRQTIAQRLLRNTWVVFRWFMEFVAVLLLGLSGIAFPSLLSSVYFLTFLIVATWWACYKSLGRKFAIARIGILIYSAIHLLLIYTYQFQIFQELLDPDSFIARILGLTAIVRTDCQQPWLMKFFPDIKWSVYVSPGLILALYYILASQTRWWYHVNPLYQQEQEKLVLGNLKAAQDSNLRVKRRKKNSGSERQALVDEDQGDKNYETIRANTPTMLADGEGNDDEEEYEVELELPHQRSALASIFVFVMNKSYAGCLIIMMAWSITYHSWLSFFMLLVACIIWMIPNNKRACQNASPFIVFYGECLIVMSYIYGLNLTDDELPVESNGFKFSEVGLVKTDYPCIDLAVQILFCSMFWLTLRQHMRELKTKSLATGLPDASVALADVSNEVDSSPKQKIVIPSFDIVDGYDGEIIKSCGEWVWQFMCKYWILVCAVLFMVMAVQSAEIYRFIYMLLLLYFILSFKLAYSWWRFSILAFWWVVIIYSMIVLVLIYTYQFDQFPGLWKNGTGLSDQILRDIGLQKYSTANLFLSLLTPTSFLIVIILQLHYFQKSFLTFSDINRYKQTEETNVEDIDVEAGPSQPGNKSDTADENDINLHIKEEGVDWFESICKYLLKFLDVAAGLFGTISPLIWRILEVHIFKLLMFTVFFTCVEQVNAINVLFVVILVISIPIPRLHGIASHCILVWCGIAMLMKMLYQIDSIKEGFWDTDCNGTDVENTYPFNGTISNNEYIGLEKADSLASYIAAYIAILIISSLEGIVWVHQAQYYNTPGVEKPKYSIIFPGVTRQNADDSLLSCFKFFVNYTFYKFGLEICFIMTVITMVVRVDAYSVIYGIILGVFLLLSRRHCYWIWPFYLIVLSFFIGIQYLSCLGAPLGICWEYPWSTLTEFTQNLQIFLYLPSYFVSPNPYKLIADFFQLLFASLQWQMFWKEKNQEEEYGGGSNKSIIEDVEEGVENPTKDFISTNDSYLDYVKVAVFMHMFWLTLVIVFIAGTTRISLFCLGYLMAVFFFLWFGQELLIISLRQLIGMWRSLLCYNYCVLLTKCVLQLVGCVYLSKLSSFCWLIQLLSIICIDDHQYDTSQSVVGCKVDEDNVGLTWDCVCFCFLILQIRTFNSHYFRHVVLELEVQNSLSARGAELINTALIKQVAIQKEKEVDVLANIKRKMDGLKARQEKLQQKTTLFNSDDHWVVIRSGDYYMFEDDDEDQSEEDPDSEDHEDAPATKDDKVGALSLINTAMSSGAKEAISKVNEQRRKSRLETRFSVVSEFELDDPLASTSGEENQAEATVEAPRPDSEEEDESLCARIKSGLSFVWEVCIGFLDYIIMVLEEISSEYRRTAQILDHEKAAEKLRIKKIYKLVQTSKDGGSEEFQREFEKEKQEKEKESEKKARVSLTRRGGIATKNRQLSITISSMVEAEDEFVESTPRLFQLGVALFNVLISRSTLLCYFAMILNMLVSASLLSLVYPLSIFLWAMLAVPRPSKTYWVTIITYTEAVVVVKYLFQFDFVPWNSNTTNDPFFPPTIIGIEKQANYAAFDLILLVCLFIHRSVLKRYGLWKGAVDLDADFYEAENKQKFQATPVGEGPSSDPKDDDDAEGGEAGVVALRESKPVVTFPTDIPEDVEDEKLCASCVQPFLDFYNHMTNPHFSAASDYYTPMFLCDFINFLIMVFGYNDFSTVFIENTGPTEGGTVVSSLIQNNKVPLPFLLMLLTQFMVIIIDRGLYLRKQVIGKFIFQIIIVALIHIWLFFLLPYITKRSFTENVSAQLLYFVKCLYFGLSAYQIRAGYPTRILGNFLTKSYGYPNLFGFKGFLMIPFLLELRAIMDWMFTDTTLSITSWLEMEDIYANIFELKCWREAEIRDPTPRGEKVTALIKYGVGGLLLFLLVFIIWFPLLLFSLADQVFYVTNLPIECTVQIQIGGFESLFTFSAQQDRIRQFEDSDYEGLKELYSTNPDVVGWITQNYQKEDITYIYIAGESTAVWGISPPSENALINALEHDPNITMYFKVSFTRSDISQLRVKNPQDGYTLEVLSSTFSLTLSSANDVSREIRKGFINQINQTASTPVEVKNLFPRYVRVPASGNPEAVLGNSGIYYPTNTTFALNSLGTDDWWKLQEITNSRLFDISSPEESRDFLTLVAFNDRVSPSSLSFLTGYGIPALYVMIIGFGTKQYLRNFYRSIMYYNMPYVDRVLKLFRNINVARTAHEWELEEWLYAKLLFIYRSPETNIKFTRYPVKKNKDDNAMQLSTRQSFNEWSLTNYAESRIKELQRKSKTSRKKNSRL